MPAPMRRYRTQASTGATAIVRHPPSTGGQSSAPLSLWSLQRGAFRLPRMALSEATGRRLTG